MDGTEDNFRISGIGICILEHLFLHIGNMKLDISAIHLLALFILETNQFESITSWEGVKGNYSFSGPDSHVGSSIPPDPGLKGGHYYISEDNFVFVIVSGRMYYEYAIALDKIREYLNEDILKKIPFE